MNINKYDNLIQLLWVILMNNDSSHITFIIDQKIMINMIYDNKIKLKKNFVR